MDIYLENQAWGLCRKLMAAIDRETFDTPFYRRLVISRDLLPSHINRLLTAHDHAYSRFMRRQRKFFNYKPDGFAPSSRHPSGVVGEGSLL